MFKITHSVSVPDHEIHLSAVRAQGAGGQNVNKVASAIHLRFDIAASSLPEPVKQRLLALPDRRISGEGVVIIKAQEFRSQDKNREAALERLRRLLRKGMAAQKKRVPTRPTPASKRRRLREKIQRGKLKQARQKPVEHE